MYPGLTLPTTMGADGAGVVDQVGEGVDAALIGRETVLVSGAELGARITAFPTGKFGLLGMPGPGTIADYICVPAASAEPKPASLSFEEAAALPTAGVTAYRALTFSAQFEAGETVLITGISGGVACFALQFALAMGARVFVTSSSDDSIARAVAMGASGGLNYKDESWRKQVGKLTGGIDVVIDGATRLQFSELPARAKHGRQGWCCMARQVVRRCRWGAPELFLKYASVIGTAMGDPDDFRAMLALVETHAIKPVIDRTFTLDEAQPRRWLIWKVRTASAKSLSGI